MKHWREIILAACLAGAIVVTFLWLSRAMHGTERVTLTSLSPDDKVRVWLVEIPAFVDRNFELRVEQVDRAGEIRTIFSSPDEGQPIGSERIVWSADSKQFVVLGRHFITIPEASLPTGEQAYLFHDLVTGETRCNATQSALRRFDVDEALNILAPTSQATR